MCEVSILPYDREELDSAFEAELLPYLRRAGIHAKYASQSLLDLDMDPEKVADYVEKNPSDAWILIAASRPVAEWFSKQSFPTMCAFGSVLSFDIAGVGPNHLGPYQQCINHLIQLGHKRITMFCRADRRRQPHSEPEQILLGALNAHGLPTNDSTLPEWEESISGFRACLDSLFRYIPPTAIILQEATFAMVAFQYLKERGVQTPEHVSLFCTDYAPCFDWCDPQIGHSQWSYKEVYQRIAEWAQNVSSGKKDRQLTIVDAEFIEGGTIGPPPSFEWNESTAGKVW